MPKIVLKNITKKFGSKSAAVENLNLVIEDRSFITLLGPSGCGKTTTLRMIAGLETPTSGEITINDEVVFSSEKGIDVPPEKRGVGFLFQNYALWPHMTVYENITFGLENLKWEKEKIKARATELMAMLKISEYAGRYPSELSGGQQQRVAIARALVKMPRVLLLDEPLSNLDARLRLQTREELKRIQQETGITTIFVTHDQEEAMSISDLIVVMKDGVVQQVDLPQRVYDEPVNLFVAKFLGTPPINVFEGQVKDGKLMIGAEAVLDVPGVSDREVYAAIRPEGFELEENGPFTCKLSSVEVMGRDISVVCTHEKCENVAIRAIIDSANVVNTAKTTVQFRLKPHKVFLFAKDTQERIRL